MPSILLKSAVMAHNRGLIVDRRTANREWRETTRNVTAERSVHAFAQRVEALTIAGCDKRHAAARSVGSLLANVAFNLAQRVGQPLSAHDVESLDKLRREWDACISAV